MAPKNLDTELTFDGSNWEDLNRLVALCRFQFVIDSDFDNQEDRRCALLAQVFQGPALDWVAQSYSANPAIFNTFDGFLTAVRQAFGVADNNITALCRRKLDELKWHPDVPVFFAEFDRLCLALSITGHATKIAMVEAKLPPHIKSIFADQALSFANYDTMRERLNTMWALKPTGTSGAAKKPKCANCHRKGHGAAECRSPSKN
ncbi:MAG: hypothetical protein EOO38_08445 [Cytophagaceae bacterium]|nr:MAG: hypothetical protein EOO38_08445 [Cytophagaceae bacterium]